MAGRRRKTSGSGQNTAKKSKPSTSARRESPGSSQQGSSNGDQESSSTSTRVLRSATRALKRTSSNLNEDSGSVAPATRKSGASQEAEKASANRNEVNGGNATTKPDASASQAVKTPAKEVINEPNERHFVNSTTVAGNQNNRDEDPQETNSGVNRNATNKPRASTSQGVKKPAKEVHESLAEAPENPGSSETTPAIQEVTTTSADGNSNAPVEQPKVGIVINGKGQPLCPSIYKKIYGTMPPFVKRMKPLSHFEQRPDANFMDLDKSPLMFMGQESIYRKEIPRIEETRIYQRGLLFPVHKQYEYFKTEPPVNVTEPKKIEHGPGDGNKEKTQPPPEEEDKTTVQSEAARILIRIIFDTIRRGEKFDTMEIVFKMIDQKKLDGLRPELRGIITMSRMPELHFITTPDGNKYGQKSIRIAAIAILQSLNPEGIDECEFRNIIYLLYLRKVDLEGYRPNDVKDALSLLVSSFGEYTLAYWDLTNQIETIDVIRTFADQKWSNHWWQCEKGQCYQVVGFADIVKPPLTGKQLDRAMNQQLKYVSLAARYALRGWISLMFTHGDPEGLRDMLVNHPWC